jgi:hypothetical protein
MYTIKEKLDITIQALHEIASIEPGSNASYVANKALNHIAESVELEVDVPQVVTSTFSDLLSEFIGYVSRGDHKSARKLFSRFSRVADSADMAALNDYWVRVAEHGKSVYPDLEYYVTILQRKYSNMKVPLNTTMLR